MTTWPYQADNDFCAIYPALLNVEGGYVNNPNDHGGPTNKGIVWKWHKDKLAPFGIHTLQDFKTKLTKEIACQFYYLHFWQASHAHRIPDRGLQLLTFGLGVHSGPGMARLMKKRLPKNPEHFEGNGKNRDLYRQLYKHFCRQCMRWYHDIVRRDPSQAVFLEGWANRINDFLVDIIFMESP